MNNLTVRKIVIVPSRQDGVELRRSLARRGEVLRNVSTETLLGLAEKAIGAKLYEGYRFLDLQVGGEILLETLSSLQKENKLEYYRDIAINAQTARAIHRTLLEVKLSYPGGSTVDFTAFAKEDKAGDLQQILDSYNALLEERKLLDRADVFRCALEKNGEIALQSSNIYLPDHLKFYPLEEEWLKRLKQNSSQFFSLPVQELLSALTDGADKPEGGKTKTKMIRGYGEDNEARQVLREIIKGGYPLDQCLVCCADYATYADIFHNLSQEYKIPMTFAAGIRLSHTVPGRLAGAMLRWLQHGCKAADFREILFGGGLALGKMKTYFLGQVMQRLQQNYPQIWNDFVKAQNISGSEKEEASKALADLLSPGSFFQIVSSLLPSWDSKANQERFAAFQQLKQNDYRKEAEKQKRRLTKELANSIWAECFFAEFTASGPEGKTSLPAGFSWVLQNFSLPRYKDKDESDEEIKKLQEDNFNRDISAQKALSLMLDRLSASGIADREAQNLLAEFIESARIAHSGSSPGQLHIAPLAKGIWTLREHIAITGLDARRFPGAPAEDPILLDQEREKMHGGNPPEHLLKAN